MSLPLPNPFPTTSEPAPNFGPNADITYGPLPPDDNNDKYVDDGTDADIWTDYLIENHYEGDRHIYMGGVTSPGGFLGANVAFVQLASPTLLWICEWTAMRNNTQPDIPDPYSPNDSNWILLDVHTVVRMTDFAGADGVTPRYRISGVYVFGHANPSSNLFANMQYPRPPWMEDFLTRTIDLATLESGLMDSSSTLRTVPTPVIRTPTGSPVFFK